MSPFRWQSPAQIITCASDQPATDQGANDPSPWVPPRPQGNISLHLPVYERTQVNSLVKKSPVQSGRVLRAGGSAGMESGRITLPVWMCLPTGSSPNPTEASLHRHDQTFNSIFRFSPFSREGGGAGEEFAENFKLQIMAWSSWWPVLIQEPFRSPPRVALLEKNTPITQVITSFRSPVSGTEIKNQY